LLPPLPAWPWRFIVAPNTARAENGEIAAGLIGGLAVGAIVGSQVNHDNGYRR
jgi:hypothetical protein